MAYNGWHNLGRPRSRTCPSHGSLVERRAAGASPCIAAPHIATREAREHFSRSALLCCRIQNFPWSFKSSVHAGCQQRRQRRLTPSLILFRRYSENFDTVQRADFAIPGKPKMPAPDLKEQRITSRGSGRDHMAKKTDAEPGDEELQPASDCPAQRAVHAR